MDKLKNFIDANRDAFEEDEMLPEGHFERFEQKFSRHEWRMARLRPRERLGSGRPQRR